MHMSWMFCTLVGWICFCGFGASTSPFVDLPPGSWLRGRKYMHKYVVSEPLASGGGAAARDTLALMFLIDASIASLDNESERSVFCSILQLSRNIGSTTPVQFYVFRHGHDNQHSHQAIHESVANVLFITVDEQSWQWPSNIATPMQDHIINQTLAARWKLSYAFDFARAQGHEYVMLLHSNTYFLSGLDHNIVAWMREHKQAMAFRDKLYQGSSATTTGLVELAQFWQATRNVHPLPGNLAGQMSQGMDAEHPEAVAWNRHMYDTSAVVVSLDFWYEAPVQNFLHLIFTTAGDLVNGWGEIGVLNMMRLLFLRSDQVHLLPQNILVHNIGTETRLFELMQCAMPGAKAANTDRDPAERVVEMVIFTHTSGAKALEASDAHKELFLLRWLFHPKTCGADTMVRNNYSQYLVAAEERYMRANLWWHKNRVDEKLERILSDTATKPAAVAADGSNADDSDRSTSSDVPTPESKTAYCQAVLREQLLQFLDFYTAYGFHGRNMKDYYDSLRNNALAQLQAAFDEVSEWFW